uniref:Transposase, MuDR, MULE transposase domain protein n=1 Tax=Tanacetum cinerariifolium TaxID=118510 RepID=A0A699JB68_TANCI|nr:transposase, MuDR, MULE transposase domain protein [Tanacetum cinerariifolium]
MGIDTTVSTSMVIGTLRTTLVNELIDSTLLEILPLATGVSQVETGKKHRGIFWKACKAYTMQALDKAISELRAYRPEARHRYVEAPVHELSDWASTKVYDRMLKSAKWIVKGIDHLQLYQVYNTKEVRQATTNRKREHLSLEARLDEERL